jgi:spore maturation protein CgeB
MKIGLFYHSLVSDWNHGNAHFLRGVVDGLMARGHDVAVYEPVEGWSRRNLVEEYGDAPLRKFREAYPGLKSRRYTLQTFNLRRAVADADLVIAHEWSDPELIRRLGEARRKREFVLLFHDTHHRLATDPASMRAYDLSSFDGVLAYGEVLRRLYLAERAAVRAWTWHEAADVRRFQPASTPAQTNGDLVWIGNWGDGERTEELMEFLVRPVKALGLKARVYGVRYPDHARAALADAGIEYAGWLPNFEAPKIFAQFKMTVHVPRRPYVTTLPGIPTIRPFEALACGIPLVCSPWQDTEHLFTPGKDFLVARDGVQMTRHLASLAKDGDRRRRLSEHGLATIRARHTCAHRVDELLAIYATILADRRTVVVPAAGLFREKINALSAAAG